MVITFQNCHEESDTSITVHKEHVLHTTTHRRWLLANYSRTNACIIPNVNHVKSTFTLTLTLILSLNLIPNKNNKNGHLYTLRCCT